MRLILVRHGETRWNEAGRYQGWEDPPLSPDGKATARRIGALLRARDLGPYTLWSSDLRRAVTTARIASGRAPRTDRRLRELHFGRFAGRTYEENLERFGARFADWVAHRGRLPPPGGETLPHLLSRTRAWLDEVRGATGPHETAVAVTHGGVIRALVRPFTHEEHWPAPGAVSVLCWGRAGAPPTFERWQLEKISDHGRPP